MGKVVAERGELRLWHGELRFLVIDDNAHFRLLLRTVLNSFGAFAVDEAADGETALNKLGECEPDIILVDMAMEPMDGVTFTRTLRTMEGSPYRFTPILMISAHTEASRVLAARDAGINEFLAKPITAGSLFKHLCAIIENPRPFVRTKDFFGPDRRRRMKPVPGPERRRHPRAPAV